MEPIDAPDAPIEIFGRAGSHFTRVVRIVAHELGVPTTLAHIPDLLALDPAAYGGHPALKLPSLRVGGEVFFGAEPACRAIAARAPGARVVWPEDLRAPLLANAHELVWHSMAAQVQLVLGVSICQLPADNPYFAKARRGLEGALGWLDARLPEVLAALPSPRALSLTEVGLYCLLEHIAWRATAPLDLPALGAFRASFGERPSARATRLP